MLSGGGIGVRIYSGVPSFPYPQGTEVGPCLHFPNFLSVPGLLPKTRNTKGGVTLLSVMVFQGPEHATKVEPWPDKPSAPKMSCSCQMTFRAIILHRRTCLSNIEHIHPRKTLSGFESVQSLLFGPKSDPGFFPLSRFSLLAPRCGEPLRLDWLDSNLRHNAYFPLLVISSSRRCRLCIIGK